MEVEDIKKKVRSNLPYLLVIAFIGILVFFLVQSRLTGGVPKIAGKHMYMVTSGSMSPAIRTGSVIFVRPEKAKNISPGDIITFRGMNAERILTTHRVMEIVEDASGNISFITRGDANNVNDPEPIKSESLIGKVVFSISNLGYLLGFARTKPGIILFVFIPATAIIIWEFYNIYIYAGKLEEETKGDKQ